jgi:hypothetical protein
MAQRHVAQAKSTIARQHEIIDELERDGHDTVMAKNLLATYEHTLKIAQLHVDRLT